MSTKEKIVYSAILIVMVAVMVAILIFLVEKLDERAAEPESVVDQEESHPHPHPLRFRSPDELRAWRVYVVSALGYRVAPSGIKYGLKYRTEVIYRPLIRLIRAERERKPILRPKPKPRKEDAL